jgi:hypothetical protein
VGTIDDARRPLGESSVRHISSLYQGFALLGELLTVVTVPSVLRFRPPLNDKLKLCASHSRVIADLKRNRITEGAGYIRQFSNNREEE